MMHTVLSKQVLQIKEKACIQVCTFNCQNNSEGQEKSMTKKHQVSSVTIRKCDGLIPEAGNFWLYGQITKDNVILNQHQKFLRQMTLICNVVQMSFE